jgi:hypothetical protein
MGEEPSTKITHARPPDLDDVRDEPGGDCRPASHGEAVRALEQQRRVDARESFDGTWGRVARIEELLELGRRTPACSDARGWPDFSLPRGVAAITDFDPRLGMAVLDLVTQSCIAKTGCDPRLGKDWRS